MPLNILIKPASGLCNMRCRYCFYLDEMKTRSCASYGIMTYETLKEVIKKALEFADDEVTFAWQGGEPTLCGIAFFKMAMQLQRQYNKKSARIQNTLQTNGYEVNREWCDFFKENNFLIGVSIDGTQETHDANRMDSRNQGTYKRCIETMEMLKECGVEFNILTVVNAQTAPRVGEIYKEYAERGYQYQQYIACLEQTDRAWGACAYSLTPKMYGEFLVQLFDLWYQDLQRGRQPYIRMFENYIGILMGINPESCEQNGICGYQTVAEADGSVYPCDFYALDAYCLGNLNKDSLEQIDKQRGVLKFTESSAAHPKKCRQCRYFFICRGGCRRQRVKTSEGELNYFCEAFRQLFDAHLEKMIHIADILK